MMPNRVAVVTGASRGVGKGIAIELCDAHFTVYITGRSATHAVGEFCSQIWSSTSCATIARFRKACCWNVESWQRAVEGARAPQMSDTTDSTPKVGVVEVESVSIAVLKS